MDGVGVESPPDIDDGVGGDVDQAGEWETCDREEEVIERSTCSSRSLLETVLGEDANLLSLGRCMCFFQRNQAKSVTPSGQCTNYLPAEIFSRMNGNRCRENSPLLLISVYPRNVRVSVFRWRCFQITSRRNRW